MSENRVVWSDENGDMRKKGGDKVNEEVCEETLVLGLRRLTSGKGRTVIEISGLPKNKSWCKKLSKNLKKSLGVGGSYKNDLIEIHGEKMEETHHFLDSKSLKWKKIGG